MSKANSPIKVLRTALHRVQKGWTKNHWSWYDRRTGKNFVCLEGAVYGFCDEKKHQPTEAQKKAIKILKEIIKENYGINSIPTFNDDRETTQEAVEEVIKLGMIRLETGGDEEDEDDDFELLEEFETQTSGG